MRRGKNQRTRRKTSRNKDKNKFNLHMRPSTRIEPRPHWVGGKWSHHCAIPAPPVWLEILSMTVNSCTLWQVTKSGRGFHHLCHPLNLPFFQSIIFEVIQSCTKSALTPLTKYEYSIPIFW